MQLRRILLFFGLSALLLTACGPSPRRTDAAAGRVIVVGDSLLAAGGSDTLRFGRMHEGEIAEMRFNLRNATQQPLVLLGCDRSCGCVSLDYEPRPILPDSTARFTARFDARGEWGWQLKLLTLHFHGTAATLRLFVEAEIAD